jgi:hypothetical protein
MRPYRSAMLLALSVFFLLVLLHPECNARELRLKKGPFEITPSVSINIQQHSNIYLSTEDTPDEVGGKKNTLLNVSDILLFTDARLNFSFKPNLERKLKGLFLDGEISPSFVYFPRAPLPPYFEQQKPDKFKFDYYASAFARYRFDPTLVASFHFNYDKPEIAASTNRFSERNIGGGAKWDLSRLVSVEGEYNQQVFHSPSSATDYENVFDESQEWSPFGSYEDGALRFRGRAELSMTLTALGFATRHVRDFKGFSQDLDQNGIIDQRKDYTEWRYGGGAAWRPSRMAVVTAEVGYEKRTYERREFGSETYDGFTGRASLITTLSPRSRLQFLGDYHMVDTYEFIDVGQNAFTGYELGAFTLIPPQFSVARHLRAVVDYGLTVNTRGDQILFGYAFQRDEMKDQLSSKNLFVPNDPNDPGKGYTIGYFDGTAFIPTNKTLAPDQTQQLQLLTAGYRLRVLKWLGLQFRGTYFWGDLNEEVERLTGPPPPGVEPDANPGALHYFAFTGGFVINLGLF